MEQYNQEKIVISEDREILAKKLAEYHTRLNPFAAPETQLSTIYKIAVLEPLVQDGTVTLEDVRTSLVNRFSFIEENIFQNAWAVMNDYVRTGGQNLVRGTGLSQRDIVDLNELNI